MVQVASAATCAPTRLVSRGGMVGRGELDGRGAPCPGRRGRDDGRGGAGPLSRRPVHQNPPCCLYQNPAARLRLIEDVGMYKPTLLRTEEPGTTGVVAFFS